jgi:hypothetical protein
MHATHTGGDGISHSINVFRANNHAKMNQSVPEDTKKGIRKKVKLLTNTWDDFLIGMPKKYVDFSKLNPKMNYWKVVAEMLRESRTQEERKTASRKQKILETIYEKYAEASAYAVLHGLSHGTNHKEEVPLFFTEETKKKLAAIRKEYKKQKRAAKSAMTHGHTSTTHHKQHMHTMHDVMSMAAPKGSTPKMKKAAKKNTQAAASPMMPHTHSTSDNKMHTGQVKKMMLPQLQMTRKEERAAIHENLDFCTCTQPLPVPVTNAPFTAGTKNAKRVAMQPVHMVPVAAHASMGWQPVAMAPHTAMPYGYAPAYGYAPVAMH